VVFCQLALAPKSGPSGSRCFLGAEPANIVSDNGTEFTSRVILKWANENDAEWHYIDLGKPQ